MSNGIVMAAVLAAWLSVPGFAADETGRGSSLPAQTTGQEVGERSAEERRDAASERYGTEERREDYREAPGAAPRGVTPPAQQQPYRDPGTVPPGAEQPGEPGAPEAGRRWGLIVFVIAIVGLGLLAFRGRGPTPPAP